MTGKRNDGATEEISEVTQEAKAIFDAVPCWNWPACAATRFRAHRAASLQCGLSSLPLLPAASFAFLTSSASSTFPEWFGLVAASHLQCHNFSLREARNLNSKKSRLTV